jgi:hypothetical protein
MLGLSYVRVCQATTRRQVPHFFSSRQTRPTAKTTKKLSQGFIHEEATDETSRKLGVASPPALTREEKREAQLRYKKQYYRLNKDKYKAWYNNSKEKVKQRSAENQEERSQYKKIYRLKNLEKTREYKHRYNLERKNQIQEYQFRNREKIQLQKKKQVCLLTSALTSWSLPF